MADTKITFRLPKKLYDQARAKAKREDIKLSQVLRRCLREWVKNAPRKRRRIAKRKSNSTQ